MKYVAIAGLTALGMIAAASPAAAQSGPIDFDHTLLSVASSSAQSEIPGIEAAEGVEMPDTIEGPEEVEGPDGVEGPDMPGDTGPNIDHQFEGHETGENGNGVPGSPGGA